MPNPSESTLKALYDRRFDETALPASARERFHRALTFYLSGSTGLVDRESIEPVPTLAELEALPVVLPEREAALLNDLVVIKLNGGLGTSMGLAQPKGILEVKPGLSFLDIATRQILALRRNHSIGMPLVLMNSFYTSEATLKALEAYPDLADGELPLEFLQSQIPKIDAATGQPASWPANPELEWCPPGHGEIYFRLIETGLLAKLKQRGYRWAFVSNIDNLGAQVDLRILQWCKERKLDFLMEATPRTSADRKGGHLARRKTDGRLILRERAQCPADQLADFEDIQKHSYFNTNNLWINLERLETIAAELRLPVIINRKTVDPTRSDSPAVVQLESAMGAAIESFPTAEALSVPRSRFVPTKNLEDLLVLRSDLFRLGPDFEVLTSTDRVPTVRLDPTFYGTLAKFEERFQTVPSLLECLELKVEGDVRWTGEPAIIQGKLLVENPGPNAMTLHSPGILSGHLTL